jgi:death on curing protein
VTPQEPTDFLTLEDLLEIAAGVVPGLAVRDVGLLASAAGRPQASAFGEAAYPTLADKVAALMHSLARNSALVDGNKRIAWAASRVFCLMNGYDLHYSVDDAETLVVSVAAGELDVHELAEKLQNSLRRE